jgi:hypothetical protein
MVIGDMLAIMLTRGMGPLETSISYYAMGPYGLLEKSGILIVSISFALIGLNLLGSRTLHGFGKTLAGFLYLAVAAGFFIVSIFNTDAGNTATIHGSVHMVAALGVTLIFPVACIVLFPSLIKNPKLKALAWYTASTGLIGLGAAVWISLPANRESLIGLSERLLAAVNLIWVAAAGPSLVKACNPSEA